MSELGYFVVLTGNTKMFLALHLASYKSNLSICFIVVSEAMAYIDSFDMAQVIKNDLETIKKSHIPQKMMTDSYFLFDVLTRPILAVEKRPMIDLQRVKDAYQIFEANYIACKRSEYNISDALTKWKDFSALFKTL